MRYIGLHLPSFTFRGVPPGQLFARLAEIARTGEENGFTAISVMDHLHQISPQGSPDEPMLEAYTTLAALAARTTRARLLTLVTGITYHNPAHLAKQVATLDVISGGRAILGIGAAWFEEEHRAYGFDFPPIGERMNRLEEAVLICRSMLDSKETTFHGRYYRAEGALNVPRPLQERVPMLIGGGGERRTLRLVARHADLWNVPADLATFAAKVEVLRRHCEAERRDEASIVKTAHAGIVVIDQSESGVRERLERMAEAPPPRYAGLDAAQLRRALVSGTHDEVCTRLSGFRAAGADGITMSIRDAADLETVAMAARSADAAFS